MQVSKVLVVDGNRTARDTLVMCLQFVGVDAHGAECAVTARSFLSRANADVIVVTDDLICQGFAEFVRDRPTRVSILVLTRECASSDTPANYQVDDTIWHSVAASHVVERVESLLVRRKSVTNTQLVFGGLRLDVARSCVEFGGRSSSLGPTEARLLGHFMSLPDKVFSRRQLLQRLWPANVRVAERTVDVHIRRLRSALEGLGCAHFIQTVRSSGYRFSHNYC
jgi:two-component system, OmpR family, phosphate regulon response regulator PhoB